MAPPRITQLELVVFEHTVQDLGVDSGGFNPVYVKGSVSKARLGILKVYTDAGIVGVNPGDSCRMIGGGAVAQLRYVAPYLIGKNALERERIYSDLKRALRQSDRTAVGAVDVALWDIAGKYHNAPVYQLLGGYRKTIPAYASTYHADENGGLASPEAFADFAEQCREMGYPAFKIHGWGGGPIERETATIRAVRRRVGDQMDLMLDPACVYDTWALALKLGRACDEANYFWLEDPYKDGGLSIFAHRKLRESIRTPLLIGEHVFGLEQHADFMVHGGTDFIRGGAMEDGGITGVMKIAHAAEGLGLDVELHVGGLAHRHCLAAIRNTNYYELGLVHPSIKRTKPPIYPLEFNDELDSIDANGHVPVPQGPGLGVEIDWDYVRKNQIETVVLG